MSFAAGVFLWDNNYMPSVSERQRKAALKELINRKVVGLRKQRKNEKTKRAFGTASEEVLRDFSQHNTK